jgi:dUTP pyrophosphatase
MSLLILSSTYEVDTMYQLQIETRRKEDSGFDLFTLETIEVQPFKTVMIKFGISCCLDNNTAYYLYPRSSICKTPLIMHDSIGVIDSGYRGEIMAPVRNVSLEPYIIEKGTRLFQLARGDLSLFDSIKIVLKLPDSERGCGGFGSTGK